MKKALLGFRNGVRMALAVGAISLLATQHAAATDLFWSGNGTTQGGAGTWNVANRWGTAAAGPYNLTWNNANVDSAIFGGTAGAVALGGNITVNDITFNTGGYSISAGSTLTFAGANPTITTNVVGTGNTTLSAVYTGTTQLTKMGTGRLELNASTNTLVGGYNIQEGFINLAAANRLGTTAATIPVSVDPDWFVFGGGGLTSSNGAAQDLGATRGMTLAGNAYFGASLSTNPVTISAPITGTGDITVANATTAGSPLNTTFNAGGIWTLSNTANDWVGNANVSAGTLRTGASNVIPDTAVVNLTLAGAQFDMGTNGTTETVKSISGTAGIIALGSAGKLTVANPAGETYSSVLTGTAGSQFIKNGSGALTLSGGSTGFSGEIVLNDGTLGIGGANSLGSNALGPVFSINGGKISNNSATGRTISANVNTKINVNLVADDSLAATQGQLNFTGPSTMVGGDRTFTINGSTTIIGFADLREDVAGRNVTKDGTGTLAFTGTATGTAFTGDVTVNAGRAQVTGTSIIGTGNNLIKLAGGALNSTANRPVATAPITNPISLTEDSAITTTSAATTVNMAFTTDSLSGTAGKTLTFRNDGANDPGDTFYPRLSGSGFDFQNDIVVDNGTTGKTQLEFANTGATVQTFSGDISGDGSINRTSGAVGSGNGGTTILTGNNTYTGGTTIEEGKLLANNTVGSATGSGAVTIDKGGTLAGTGAVSGPVTVNGGGTLAPGASIETLDVGALSFNTDITNGGSKFAYEINSNVALNMAADLVNVNGNLSIAMGAILSLVDLGNTVLPLGTKFTLISYAGSWDGGTFAMAPDDGFVTDGSNNFEINYNDTVAGSNFGGGSYGNYLTITAIAAVPEASTILFGGMLCLALGSVHVGRKLIRRRAAA